MIISMMEVLTPPLQESAVLQSSSFFHHVFPTEGQSTAIVTNVNEHHWELEQATELNKCSKFVVNTCGGKWANRRPYVTV